MELHGVAAILEDIGILLELKGENPFKSRAYYSAARTVEMLGEEELKKIVHQDKLKDVKGIGPALNDKIRELVTTGSLPYYEELKKSVPEGLMEILKVPGLGPRKVSALYNLLDISSIAELEYACRENRLVNLKGFGLKTQQNILEGIDFLRRHEGRFFFSEAHRLAVNLIEKMKVNPLVAEVSLAGSIRRCLEIVKDIDLVASSTKPKELAAAFSTLPSVTEVLTHGETKVSVRLQEGINADLRIVEPEQFPYALHHFTGSREHNTALRQRAKKMGLKINEYGLFRDQKLIACSNEEEFFTVLGLAYIAPELRENNGEIEAAEKGTLPDLVEMKDIRGIFHVHTTYSDGVDELEKIVQACLSSGYEYVGISDHSQSAFYAGGLKESDLLRQHEEIEILREKYPAIAIFSGIESDILNDGSLDYPDPVLDRLDFVIASVHSNLKMDRSKMTARLVRAISNPRVTMLGHPTNRLLLGRDSSQFDLDEIFNAASEHAVVLELNANPARLDLDWRHLKKVHEKGLLVSINPDAHQVESIDDTAFGLAIARKGWLEKKDVFNTRGRKELEKYLRGRKKAVN